MKALYRVLLPVLSVVVLCLPADLPAHAATGRGLHLVYVSPVPDSRYNLPGTNIIVRTDRPLGVDAASRLIASVSGSTSGAHTYSCRVSDDGRTLLCQPESPFSPSERVTVVIDTTVAPTEGTPFHGTLRFTIAGPHTDFSAVEGKLRAVDFPESVSAAPGAGRWDPSGTPGDVVLPRISVTVATATSPGYLFLSNLMWDVTSVPALLILRNDGTELFARNIPANGYDFKPQPNGMLTYFDDESQTFIVMDRTFTVVDTIRCGNGYATDPHELEILPDGHALLLGVDPEIVDMSKLTPGGYGAAQVVGYIIQELDQSKNVVFQWRSWDHYTITDAEHIDLTAGWIDYVHGNSLDVDTDGNLLFSSRHLNEITKINRQTGDIIWRLGGANNQFRFVNDPIGFSFQHAVRRIANGNITLFDNGDFHVPAFSRAVEYAVDEETKTATLVWQYRNTPDVFGFAMGFVQRMENGNTLIAWGAGNPTVTEVTPGGTKVFEMTFDAGVYSYRGFRYEWEPAISSAERAAAPTAYALRQNYPNPFNPSTTIQYSLPRESHVTLGVFDLIGRRVATLVDAVRPAGDYAERLDGAHLASGVYIYSLNAGGFTATRRMILLR
ncbi:MAG TPA: aryl-sulfate sulfotransferase [Bacteroidota bacterium]|nr:aryl-sulfate sulfotransferase [Bacteroidota bacterium]